MPCGTCPAATCRRAESMLCCDRRRRCRRRRPRGTRPCRGRRGTAPRPGARPIRAGYGSPARARAPSAVTSAVRIGAASPGGNASCSRCSASRKPRNGPPDSGSRAFSRSCAPNALDPRVRDTRSPSSPKITRVAVEGDAQLLARRCAGLRRQDGRGGDARVQRAPHRFRVRRQEQLRAEGPDVGHTGAPEVNVARRTSVPWCWMELNTRRPVSAELRDSKITSTCGPPGGTFAFNASSLRTSGNATPGASGSSSCARWWARKASTPSRSNKPWLSSIENSAREVMATTSGSARTGSMPTLCRAAVAGERDDAEGVEQPSGCSK